MIRGRPRKIPEEILKEASEQGLTVMELATSTGHKPDSIRAGLRKLGLTLPRSRRVLTGAKTGLISVCLMQQQKDKGEINVRRAANDCGVSRARVYQVLKDMKNIGGTE